MVWPAHGREYGAAGPPLLTLDPDTGEWNETSIRLGDAWQPDLESVGGVVLQPDGNKPVFARLAE